MNTFLSFKSLIKRSERAFGLKVSFNTLWNSLVLPYIVAAKAHCHKREPTRWSFYWTFSVLWIFFVCVSQRTQKKRSRWVLCSLDFESIERFLSALDLDCEAKLKRTAMLSRWKFSKICKVVKYMKCFINEITPLLFLIPFLLLLADIFVT